MSEENEKPKLYEISMTLTQKVFDRVEAIQKKLKFENMDDVIVMALANLEVTLDESTADMED